MTERVDANEEYRRQALDTITDRLIRGVGPDGEPIDFSEISTRAYKKTQAYAEKRHKGQRIAAQRVGYRPINYHQGVIF